MRSAARTVEYAVLGLLGAGIMYSALAHPPFPRSELGYGLAPNADTGVHLNADGTIDYYKADSAKTFEHAYLVLLVTTGLGTGLVLRSVQGLRESVGGGPDGDSDAPPASRAE